MDLSTPTLCVLAFALSMGATFVVRGTARKFGVVAKPKADRWHTKPTAMMGGVAIFIATIAAVAPTVPRTREILVVLIASSAMFLVGLIDDFIQMKPYQKLFGQLLAASAVIYFGLVLPWTAWLPLNMLITVFWLVGVTNAVNMLDNMDGLATGISAIAAGALSATFHYNGQPLEATLLAVFAATLLGFLVFNHNPASIFMGDCGSMFIGFFLASAALMAATGGGGRSRSVLAVLAVPVLVLCIPIFDTTFVTIMRKLAGRAASQGGRDHTSHRLVALGLSERKAVWMLYGFALLAGGLATMVRGAELDLAIAAIATFAIALSILGVYLAGVRVYSDEELAAAEQKPLVAFLVDLSYKRRIFEIILDVALIALAYYGAYRLTFGSWNAGGDWALYARTLPLVVSVKLIAMYVTGLYKGLWRYASISDAITYTKAVVVGSVLTVVVLVFAFRFDGFSRTVIAIDGVLLLAAIAASRFAFRALRRLIPSAPAKGALKIAIYGAGDGGELMFRELRNNTALGMVPVAFLDDDPRKVGKTVHGLPVYAPLAMDALSRAGVQQVLIATGKISEARLLRVLGACTAAGIAVQQMKLEIRPIHGDGLRASVSPRRDSQTTIQAIPGTIVATDQ